MRSGLKTRHQGFAVGVECGDIIGKSFVFASVALILGGVFQKVRGAVAGRDFGQVDSFPGSKDRLHGFGVAGDFLLVTASE